MAERYARHHGLALSTVGRLAGGHGHFFERVADGRVTIRRVGRAVQWFSDCWPAELEWPEELQRPAPGPEAPAEAADPLQAVRAAHERVAAAAASGDSMALHAAEEAALKAGSTLRADGRIASPVALCEALHVSRDIYYDVVRRFAGTRGARRHTRTGSASERVLGALVASGDTRFALRRALHGTAAVEPSGGASNAVAGRKMPERPLETPKSEDPSTEVPWRDRTTNTANGGA